MLGKLLIGFGVAIMLSALAMGGLPGSSTVDAATPFGVFAAGLLVSFVGGRIRDGDLERRRRAAQAPRGMWSAPS